MRLHRPGLPKGGLLLAKEATALNGAKDGGLWLAENDRLRHFASDGTASLPVRRIGAGATALAEIGGRMLVGFRDGTTEPFALAGTAGGATTFEGSPGSAVLSLLEGPGGTFVGTARGLVGIWGLRDGRRLLSANMHGPVTHLAIAGGELLAASELGEHLRIPLGAFERSWCELLHEVWSDVSVGWESGHAVLQPAPSTHSCAKSGP